MIIFVFDFASQLLCLWQNGIWVVFLNQCFLFRDCPAFIVAGKSPDWFYNIIRLDRAEWPLPNFWIIFALFTVCFVLLIFHKWLVFLRKARLVTLFNIFVNSLSIGLHPQTNVVINHRHNRLIRGHEYFSFELIEKWKL